MRCCGDSSPVPPGAWCEQQVVRGKPIRALPSVDPRRSVPCAVARNISVCELLYLCAFRVHSELPLLCESYFVEIVGRALLCVVIVSCDPTVMGRVLSYCALYLVLRLEIAVYP